MVDSPETMAPTPQKVMQDAAGLVVRSGRRFWTVTFIVGAVFLAGIVAFSLRMRDGFEDRASWGYYAAMFAYLLAIVASAPLVAVGLRLAKADWRRSLTRPAELFAALGLFTVLLFIPLLYLVPGAERQSTIWLGWPYAPHLYDTLALVMLVVCGSLFLYTSALPDLAALRDTLGPGWKKRWLSRLAGRWQGSARHWRLQRGALALFGVFYFMLLVLVQALI
ncbi:MAG: hypothetical protein HY680_02255, partial [Chloroflexi bacterium]|nr:hypothetical protein [Chloroflexota bacterium]